MGAPGGVPSSPVLAGIGRGRLFRSKAAVLQRFDGTAWRDVARYPTIRDADAALDHQVGEGQEPGEIGRA
ncbi:MAG: hypothetical protein ACJ76A_07895, partial [Actinomycetota bacterium]